MLFKDPDGQPSMRVTGIINVLLLSFYRVQVYEKDYAVCRFLVLKKEKT